MPDSHSACVILHLELRFILISENVEGRDETALIINEGIWRDRQLFPLPSEGDGIEEEFRSEVGVSASGGEVLVNVTPVSNLDGMATLSASVGEDAKRSAPLILNAPSRSDSLSAVSAASSNDDVNFHQLASFISLARFIHSVSMSCLMSLNKSQPNSLSS